MLVENAAKSLLRERRTLIRLFEDLHELRAVPAAMMRFVAMRGVLAVASTRARLPHLRLCRCHSRPAKPEEFNWSRRRSFY